MPALYTGSMGCSKVRPNAAALLTSASRHSAKAVRPAMALSSTAGRARQAACGPRRSVEGPQSRDPPFCSVDISTQLVQQQSRTHLERRTRRQAVTQARRSCDVQGRVAARRLASAAAWRKQRGQWDCRRDQSVLPRRRRAPQDRPARPQAASRGRRGGESTSNRICCATRATVLRATARHIPGDAGQQMYASGNHLSAALGPHSRALAVARARSQHAGAAAAQRGAATQPAPGAADWRSCGRRARTRARAAHERCTVPSAAVPRERPSGEVTRLQHSTSGLAGGIFSGPLFAEQ